MTLVLFGLTVVCTLISCGAAVVSVIYSRRPASVELQSNVDEIGALVEKLLKQQRKVRMSNVRNAALENPDDSGSSDQRPDPGIDVNKQPIPPTKVALIAAARQKGFRV